MYFALVAIAFTYKTSWVGFRQQLSDDDDDAGLYLGSSLKLLHDTLTIGEKSAVSSYRCLFARTTEGFNCGS